MSEENVGLARPFSTPTTPATARRWIGSRPRCGDHYSESASICTARLTLIASLRISPAHSQLGGGPDHLGSQSADGDEVLIGPEECHG